MRLAVHDLGGDGDLLLVVHATGFCGRAYSQLAETLEGYHVLAVDMRGHGDSPPPSDDDFSWAAMAEDIVETVTPMGSGMCLVGHSIGGAVALAAQDLEPRLFGRAFLFEPAILPAGVAVSPAENLAAVEGARRRTSTFRSRADALWRFAGRPPLNSLCAASLHDYVLHGFAEASDGQVRLRCDPQSEALIYLGTGQVTTADLVVDIPVVIARGARSTGDLLTVAPQVARELGADFVELPEGGHLGPLEHPTSVASAILASMALKDRG